MRIAIVGGGISGLTAAQLLAAGGQDVTLFDDADEPGGLIRSRRIDGFLCERGPQAVLDGPDEVRALIAAAGLSSRALAPRPAARRRFVYVGGALRPFPASPPALFRTSLLSARGKLRLFAEPFVRRPATPDPDESVFAFVARRFGPEAARRAAAPALIGITAGDAETIAVRAAFPRLAQLEDQHGSILRGMFRSRGKSRLGRPTTFPDGLDELPRALAAQLGPRRRVARVTALSRRPGGWSLETDRDPSGQAFQAERVLLATPAAVTADLLAPHAAAAAAALRAIPHAPVAVVTLGFRAPAEALGMDLEAYGFVAARGEGVALLGCQYETSVFPGRAPEGAVLMRALLGGTFDPTLVDGDDGTVSARAVGDLRRAAGLRRDPDFVDVWRARPGIPQAQRGHAARVAAVDAALAGSPACTRSVMRSGASASRPRSAPGPGKPPPRCASPPRLDSGARRSDSVRQCVPSRTLAVTGPGESAGVGVDPVWREIEQRSAGTAEAMLQQRQVAVRGARGSAGRARTASRAPQRGARGRARSQEGARQRRRRGSPAAGTPGVRRGRRPPPRRREALRRLRRLPPRPGARSLRAGRWS